MAAGDPQAAARDARAMTPPSPARAFRWDVSRQEQLGRLLAGPRAVAYRGFMSDLLRRSAGLLDRAGDADLLFAAGAAGRLRHRGPGGWRRVPPGTTEDLVALHGQAGGRVVVVGAGGAVLEVTR